MPQLSKPDWWRRRLTVGEVFSRGYVQAIGGRPFNVQKRYIGRTWPTCGWQSIACTAVHLPVLVDKLVMCLIGPHRLSLTKKQVAIGREREGELIEYVFLQFRREVDEHVATHYEVNAWERCTPAEILLPEDDHLAQRL